MFLNPITAGSFVPEMSEVAHRSRFGFGGNSDEPDPLPGLMDGWTEEDHSRFLAALRAIGSPFGRRTELGFREWMTAVAEEVRRDCRSCAAVHATPC